MHKRVTSAQLHASIMALAQLFTFTMLLTLVSNNVGMLWVAMEAATLSAVLLVSLYRTPASWKAVEAFILCSVSRRSSARSSSTSPQRRCHGAGSNALTVDPLAEGARRKLEPTVCRSRSCSSWSATQAKVASRRCTTGCPTRARGAPTSRRCFPGLLLNVALYAVVRAKVLVDGALEDNFSGALMMGFGLLSVVVAAFFLSRQKDIKRMFAYSSVEHMGIMTFAFGMGGAVAAAGLLHMTVHSLTKSAIFLPSAMPRRLAAQDMASIRA